MLREPIRLHMNEAPYPPAQDVIEAARRGLSSLNRYADPKELERLRGLLAGYCGVPRRHVIPSPGSDLLLREVIHTFSQGRKVIMVSPSFSQPFNSRKAILCPTAQHSAQPTDVRSEPGTPDECVGRAQPGDHRQSQQPHG